MHVVRQVVVRGSRVGKVLLMTDVVAGPPIDGRGVAVAALEAQVRALRGDAA